jgi:rRNA maturation endonuclease Nob1
MNNDSYFKTLCPKCKTMNQYKAHFCHKCGENLEKYPESKTKVTVLDRGGILF